MFREYGSNISQMYIALLDAYSQPNLWHVVASMAHIFILAIVFFFIEGICRKDDKLHQPKNPAARQILYYSEHISKYYALHIIVYFVALGINGYECFQSYQCWLLALLSILVTEIMVRGYNMLQAKIAA